VIAVVGNVYAFFKWNSKFITKDNCIACKKESKMVGKEVQDDIKNIKTALIDEIKDIKTLGVIQVLMCKHVGMDKEEIDMLKDALENGTDITSLL
jgi:hypothetical protein